MTEPIEIVDYDPRWPTVFATLRARIAAALGPLARRIEHVGSTAVPGLPAKPIIDLDVIIAPHTDLAAVIGRLNRLGYQHEGDLGIAGREAFTTPANTPPHHLYVCAMDNPELERHLAFRDFLRSHPETAATYANLKRSLANRYRTDRAAYSKAKGAFIERVMTATPPTKPGHATTRGPEETQA